MVVITSEATDGSVVGSNCTAMLHKGLLLREDFFKVKGCFPVSC